MKGKPFSSSWEWEKAPTFSGKEGARACPEEEGGNKPKMHSAGYQDLPKLTGKKIRGGKFRKKYGQFSWGENRTVRKLQVHLAFLLGKTEFRGFPPPPS